MSILCVPNSVADILRVIEVSALDEAGKELFLRTFKAPPPEIPRHFVVHYGESFEFLAGYVHFTPLENIYLGGGMCLDARLYRRMGKEHRDRIAHAGGFMEVLLRASFAGLADKEAVFGYCGDTKAMRVDLRAGFVPTNHPHLIVYWPHPLPLERQTALVDMAHRVGPF